MLLLANTKVPFSSYSTLSLCESRPRDILYYRLTSIIDYFKMSEICQSMWEFPEAV